MRPLRSVIIFTGAMFLQWWWNTHLSYWGAAPQFLLALTVLLAARRGPVPAMLFGFTWGLYADALRADLFGANALLYTLAGYAAGAVRKQLDLREAGPLAVTVFVLSWGYVLMIGFLGAIFDRSFFWVGWVPALFTPFLNVLAAFAATLCCDIWGER
ncbi:MAG: rod shape-determining protein MreD [Elusimicrobiota bacterium]